MPQLEQPGDPLQLAGCLSGADGFRRAEPEAKGPGSRVGTTERRSGQVC